MVGLAGHTGEERLTSLLEKLAPAAARAVGAKAVDVMLASDGEQLIVHSASNSLQTLGRTESVIVPDGLLAQARNERDARRLSLSRRVNSRLELCR